MARASFFFFSSDSLLYSSSAYACNEQIQSHLMRFTKVQEATKEKVITSEVFSTEVEITLRHFFSHKIQIEKHAQIEGFDSPIYFPFSKFCEGLEGKKKSQKFHVKIVSNYFHTEKKKNSLSNQLSSSMQGQRKHR